MQISNNTPREKWRIGKVMNTTFAFVAWFIEGLVPYQVSYSPPPSTPTTPRPRGHHSDVNNQNFPVFVHSGIISFLKKYAIEFRENLQDVFYHR